MVSEAAREVGSDLHDPSGGWVEVGRVARAHGLSGALLVALYGDDPQNLLRAERIALESDATRSEFVVSRTVAAGTRGGSARVRVWLSGLDGRDQADAWRGASLSIPESALEALPSGEYYWRDLIGLSCRTLEGRELGAVEEIWATGSNDVLVVRDGSVTHLVPALRHVLRRVDVEEGVVWIEPIDGMLEES